MAGFPYSEAMKSHPGNWTFEELAKYLHDPKADIPGNKMAFAGVKDNAELADLLVYLRKLVGQPGRRCPSSGRLRCGAACLDSVQRVRLSAEGPPAE